MYKKFRSNICDIKEKVVKNGKYVDINTSWQKTSERLDDLLIKGIYKLGLLRQGGGKSKKVDSFKA